MSLLSNLINVEVLRTFLSSLNTLPVYINTASNYTDSEKDRLFEIIDVLAEFEQYLFYTYEADTVLISSMFEIDSSEASNPTKQTLLYSFTTACDNSLYESKQEVLDAISDFYDIIRK